jgi:hypothetical protein
MTSLVRMASRSREEALTPYPTGQIVNPSRQFTRNKED